MRIRRAGRQRVPGASRAPAVGRASDSAAGTWARTQLRERIRQAGAAPGPSDQRSERPDADERELAASREGGPSVTADSNLTTGMTPVEAANLLVRLEDGHQAAWLATDEAPWQSTEHESRFQNAAEVDDVFRDLMWETVQNGMRRPGEPVEEFAARAESEARHAETRQAGTDTPAGLTEQQADAGMSSELLAASRDEIAARLLSDASTPEGQAYARALSDSAAAYVRELRQCAPLPEPDRTPGAPHPDPFLASRGWHMNEHGVYTRRATPEPQTPPERELEPEP
jgi:hypothetical protein